MLETNKISFIGLGKLGLGLALSLASRGFEVIGIDVVAGPGLVIRVSGDLLGAAADLFLGLGLLILLPLVHLRFPPELDGVDRDLELVVGKRLLGGRGDRAHA